MAAKPLSLAISTFKGGAGKSTLNVNLAAEFAQQGHRTLLIDCDEQESSTRWYNVSMKRGLLPTDGTLLHLRVAPGDQFRDRLADAPEADIRIYDVGGYVHQRAIEVYHECDAVLIPIIPEPTAATSAIKVATILKEISKKRPQGPIPYAAIWNYVDMIALKHNKVASGSPCDPDERQDSHGGDRHPQEQSFQRCRGRLRLALFQAGQH
ncbi:ParA family protein [Rhizobium johnstonii]|uniref:ParA family protein n=1 Tax=Rhizobium johnstonii TaxID=3019933 RepID=UPI003F94EE30